MVLRFYLPQFFGAELERFKYCCISFDILWFVVQLQVFKKEVLRFPRLDTVLMIEEAVRKAKSDLTVRQIWLKLPKKVMWQTFLTTLDYLEYSGKILIDKEGFVVWIWDPKGIEELKKKGLLVR